MNTNSRRTLLALGVAFALAAGSASATNGYYTHGLGTKNKAQAGAGSANPEELMVLGTNPAGIAFVGDSLDAGLGFFSPMRDYKTTPVPPELGPPGACSPMGCANTIGPNKLSSKNELFFVPYVGAKWSLSDVDHLALAFYGRGGMNTKWVGGTATYDPTFGQGPDGPQTFPGTFGDGTAGVDLMQGFLNLSYARKLTDTFSGGVSAIFAMQRFEARGVSNFAPFTKTYVKSYFETGMPTMPKNLSDNGHDMSYGYGASIGFQWTPVEMFSLAAAYTSKMSMSDFGDYKDLFAQGGGFDMPSTWTIGIAVRPTDGLALMFDVQEISYSDVDSVANPIQNLFQCPILNPQSTNVEYCLGGNKGAGFGWDDMTVYKLGVAWDVTEGGTLRFGYSTTDQPIGKDQMTFNILAPGVMEDHWTVGYTMKRSSGNEWNVSFMYAPEVKISGPQNFDPRQNVQLKMDQFELEIGYSWKR